MDTIRQLRFLLPPSVFVGAALLAKYSNGTLLIIMEMAEGHVLTALGALLAASLLPLGFILGALSILVLLGLSKALRGMRYDRFLSGPEIEALIGRLYQAPSVAWPTPTIEDGLALEQSILFQHDKEWIAKKVATHWDALQAHFGSLLALLFALPIAWDACRWFWWFWWAFLLTHAFATRYCWTEIDRLLRFIAKYGPPPACRAALHNPEDRREGAF